MRCRSPVGVGFASRGYRVVEGAAFDIPVGVVEVSCCSSVDKGANFTFVIVGEES